MVSRSQPVLAQSGQGEDESSGGWRGIENAPARTLIVAADHVRKYYAVGRMNAHGEFEQTDKSGVPMGIGFYPTHWLPLPRPHEEPESGSDGR
jgi:hypothetical protein